VSAVSRELAEKLSKPLFLQAIAVTPSALPSPETITYVSETKMLQNTLLGNPCKSEHLCMIIRIVVLVHTGSITKVYTQNTSYRGRCTYLFTQPGEGLSLKVLLRFLDLFASEIATDKKTEIVR
jgi:hypothetical protein